jgi:hypothetical protein
VIFAISHKIIVKSSGMFDFVLNTRTYQISFLGGSVGRQERDLLSPDNNLGVTAASNRGCQVERSDRETQHEEPVCRDGDV